MKQPFSYPSVQRNFFLVDQSLVDDGLVDKEKIGGFIYFWSFPAMKDSFMQIQYQKTLAETENLKGVLQETNTKLLDAKRVEKMMRIHLAKWKIMRRRMILGIKMAILKQAMKRSKKRRSLVQ